MLARHFFVEIEFRIKFEYFARKINALYDFKSFFFTFGARQYYFVASTRFRDMGWLVCLLFKT